MTMAAVPSAAPAATRPRLLAVLGDEGFRLFFPLAALQAAFWPLLWVGVHGFALPFARTVPASLWHGHEMLVGAYGAAVIGFLTTAVPEWTDTAKLSGRPLYVLAAAWGLARLVGLLGADALGPVAALADAIWLLALPGYVLAVSWRKRTGRLLAFALWLGALAAAALATRIAFALGALEPARLALRLVAFALLGLLGLALSRITVPVTNLVLDPSETSSPFRPHPGRLNLASGLVAVAMAGELAGLSAPVTGYLCIAAGAAFLDRVAEAFIGREAFRAEILALAGSSALAGLGLIALGAARLGAPLPETTALHVVVMGGLGLGVLAVFAIAGRLHTGRPLGLARPVKLAFLAVLVGTALRVAPDLGLAEPPGPPHLVAALAWAAGFLLWLAGEWPALSDPGTRDARRC